ncbi:tetratricopeptide repeat protein [Clostridium sp. D53t1_180928_C8]|uniref:tetratricopeptide repeat protein n=1 Tax=Clostridium sp. D53t1_180928_C8 TaxID=2787101 RepID=UPI0018AB233B|nr:tetratricopeptide repeat protein [Clostridium sp. D53t1_180928_C8]
MKKRAIIQVISVILLGYLAIGSLEEVIPTAKEVVISENVREDIKAEEEEVYVLKRKANEYLEQNSFDDAKSLYEKAILMDKGNKDLYIEIKDEYIKYNRLDDAYNIVKMAIDNKVDIDNMNTIITDIKNKFEKIQYNYTVVQGDKYELPVEGIINVNGKDISVPIFWSEKEVNTNNTGSFIYEGVNEQYGRSFIVNLSVEYRQLTEKEIRELSLRAKNAVDSVIDSINLDLDNIIVEGERNFAPSYKYKTRQQSIEDLSEYCTNDTIYDLIENHTIEKEGQLYIVCGNFGCCSQISLEYDDIKIEQTETTLKAVYSKQINASDDICIQTYNFIKYNDSWLLTDFYVYK